MLNNINVDNYKENLAKSLIKTVKELNFKSKEKKQNSNVIGNGYKVIFLTDEKNINFYYFLEKNLYKINHITLKNPIIQVYFSISIILLDCYGYIWNNLSTPNCKPNLYTKDFIRGPFFIGSYIKFICSNYMIGYDNTLWFLKYIDNSPSLLHFSQCEFNKTVKLINCGENFVILLCDDFSLWSKGNNDEGQLALGETKKYIHHFTQIKTKEKFISISCGKSHSMLLNSFYKVFTCGSNKNGQLGLPSNILNSSTLISIENLFFISLILCKKNSSFCIDFDGNLFTFGGKNCFFEIKKIKSPPICFISNGIDNDTIFFQDVNEKLWVLHENKKKPSKLNLSRSDENISVKQISSLHYIEYIEELKEKYVSSFIIILFEFFLFILLAVVGVKISYFVIF